MTYKLEFDVKLGKEESKEQEEESSKAMRAITSTVSHLIALALEDKSTCFYMVHPRQLIAIITTNILLNLFIPAVSHEDNPLKTRLQMAKDLMHEVDSIFMDCVQKLEMVREHAEGGMH